MFLLFQSSTFPISHGFPPFLAETFRTAFEAGGSNVRNDAESTGSAHHREVRRRSILLHKCPDPGDGGAGGQIQKATQAFKRTRPHLKWNLISICQMERHLERWCKAGARLLLQQPHRQQLNTQPYRFIPFISSNTIISNFSIYMPEEVNLPKHHHPLQTAEHSTIYGTISDNSLAEKTRTCL